MSEALLARERRLQPAALTADYKSTIARAPRWPLLSIDDSLSERTGPVFARGDLGPHDADLLRNHGAGGTPIGERILVHGHVREQSGRPVGGALVEIWQANAGGRYRHARDAHLAPLDPHFGGCGRTLTDECGRYAFRTVRPGAYPFRNHANSWRMAHIHFSLFGAGFAQRLVTQMYFEGDPLRAQDPIARTVPDEGALERLMAPLDLEASVPLDCLAWRFDIVLRGRRQTPFENRPEGL